MSENIDHPSLKAIVKSRNIQEISILDSSKAIHATDITVKVIKNNNKVLVEQICAYFNESVGKGKFTTCSKLVNITPRRVNVV